MGRSKIYINGLLVVNNDGIHAPTYRVCEDILLTTGRQQEYRAGFHGFSDSVLEVTYSGPDTYGVRTVIGGRPFANNCDPRNPTSRPNMFTLCTFKSDPTPIYGGTCTPAVGKAHPRFPGPCAKALGTSSYSYYWYSGGWRVPTLGSADEEWVFITTIFIQFLY